MCPAAYVYPVVSFSFDSHQSLGGFTIQEYSATETEAAVVVARVAADAVGAPEDARAVIVARPAA